jgi:NADPH:quinone reductase
VLGSEIAGTVAAVGDGVPGSWIGRRVWAFTGLGGGYAEQAIIPAEALVPLPAGLSAVDAVTLGTSGAVSPFGLRHAHFAPGESVLVRGAAGGIGIMTVQLAARGGASAVAVTASSAERGDRLGRLGATHVLDRAGRGGANAPVGYDVIIDIIAGPDLASFFARLNPNGRLVAVGAMAGDPPADFGLTMFAAFQKSMSFATFSATPCRKPTGGRRRPRCSRPRCAASCARWCTSCCRSNKPSSHTRRWRRARCSAGSCSRPRGAEARRPTADGPRRPAWSACPLGR